jgi:LysM repeat protein
MVSIRRTLTLMIITVLLGFATQPAHAQSRDPYTVIALVNDLRAQNGLPPYEVNPQLMSAAQAHSEWAASVGTHSHTGPGGTTPRDRAIAAGYGGGESVRVSENIQWGSNATAESALQWWTNSPIHYAGMTSTNYNEIGAGVAYGEYGGFFTLKFGMVLDGTQPPYSPPAAPPSSGGSSGPVYNVVPVEVSAPAPDGSITHRVEEGQTVWDISVGYDVPVSEILALNALTEDDPIYPGNKLLVQPAPIELQQEVRGPLVHTVESGQTLGGIAAAYGIPLERLLTLNGLNEESIIRPGDELTIRTGDPTPTPIPRPEATPWPTPTASPPALAASPPPRRTAVAQVPPTSDEQPPPAAPSTQPGNMLLVGGLGLVGIAGAGLIVGGLFVLKEEEDI